MTRVGLDGIIVSNVTGAIAKTGAKIVSGYTDGRWPDYNGLVASTPGLLHVSITVNRTDVHARCGDVETGDMSPEDAPGWVKDARDAGNPYPWIYCDAANWITVKNEFTAQKVAEPLYYIANYDDTTEIPAGAIGHQHTNTPAYDISSFVDYIPGLDPAPVTATPSGKDDEMPAQIEPLTVHPGEYAYGVDESDGRTEVRFNADGYGAQAELRVVTWDAKGCDVHNVVVGGSGNGQAEHQTVVKFPNPTSTYGVTVRRVDHVGFPVGISFR